jgi:predicted KAP-like P-loop ATPase
MMIPAILTNRVPIMEASRPDAPIKTASEDRLGRASFVRQLARALIRLDGSASGGVVGLTGEWGSGKSSVLNLLEEQISIDYKDNPIIVRFNPWLVSGRDDLIASFFHCCPVNTRIDSIG